MQPTVETHVVNAFWTETKCIFSGDKELYTVHFLQGLFKK